MSRLPSTIALIVAAALALAAPAAAAPPDGYSTFKDRFSTTTAPNQLVPVATLRVPAGAEYAVFAKAYLAVPRDGLGQTVQCDLIAGSDFDRVWVSHDGAIAFATVALNVVHRFGLTLGTFRTRASILLRCGVLFSGGPLDMNFIKITAISLNSLSNVPAP
jgi:hypothetical protein